ncbi:MAG: acetyl-CoA carboxylase biotin carboxyl carrier protein [Bacteroidia bacterium]|nr:acetyl-CoA carboxylase biotin carboxyl carrier protein [Bacteroidia bacterium]
MKLNEIQDLIKFVAKSGVSEVELETKEIKIVIKTPAAGKGKMDAPVLMQAPVMQTAQPMVQQPLVQQVQQTQNPVVENTTPVAPKNNGADESKYVIIKSPMIGTFYRSAGPDKPAFVNVGDDIGEGSPVCIIEAMKLFNEIESDVKGKIVKVLATDASPVEYDQPLFMIDPA